MEIEFVKYLPFNENTRIIEDQTKHMFVKDALESLGIDLSEVWTDEELVPSVNTRIALRNFLNSYNIRIIDDLDGGLQIYYKSELVASWKKASYKLQNDINELDPKKRLYTEMYIKAWVVDIEEEQDNE